MPFRSEPKPPSDWVNNRLQAFESDGFSINNLQSDTDFTFTCRGIDNNLVSETVTVSVTEAPPAPAPTAPTQNNDADSIAFNETA